MALRDAVSGPRPRILLADDETKLLQSMTRLLTDAGYEVLGAVNGLEATALLTTHTFDAIVTDIRMPALDGIQVLRAARERDSDVPVILITAAPDLSTAIEAVTYGALQYLLKPFDPAELKTVVARAVRACRIARIKREALLLVSEGGLGASDRVGLEVTFARAVETLWMAYQPIVRALDGSLFGYEALLRCEEPMLSSPSALLDAAERLDRLGELAVRIRSAAAAPMHIAPEGALLFVNINASDLADPMLAAPDSPLARIASRVVLEITERASLDRVPEPRTRIAELRKMGFRIAIDDLGAGYSGLTSFAAMEPQFIKLDGSLVRGVDRSSTKQRLIRSMTALCNDLAIITVAEGIETQSERETVVGLGCDLLQGYLFAKPDKPFPEFEW